MHSLTLSDTHIFSLCLSLVLSLFHTHTLSHTLASHTHRHTHILSWATSLRNSSDPHELLMGAVSHITVGRSEPRNKQNATSGTVAALCPTPLARSGSRISETEETSLPRHYAQLACLSSGQALESMCFLFSTLFKVWSWRNSAAAMSSARRWLDEDCQLCFGLPWAHFSGCFWL
jgi:hypothetical protein